ncbi:ATP-dependent helicase [Amycolatopsis sp. CA-230715]|uniref:ATP-dependent helicase n=1 Tax=Amycolatopsis sp. CA-230715 TaxID=2745196 RepID=UPI001C012AC7|nr:ATP-dependent helicase [Amycolatopsis sp. CA-230715]QWF80989.1 ATP-dependent DNA helicase Rep [Amycolatopsis sp. CA-230715]
MSALSASIADLKHNPQQWQAFTSQGHCVVLAPPGSGKTKLLATRLAYDLINKIPKPQGATCITLTNAAADELRRRVESLGVESRSNLFVGTVHGFALGKIIAPFAEVVGREDLVNISIASENQCRSLLKDAIAEVFGNDNKKHVDSTIKINRERLAGDEDWARHSDKVREACLRYEAKLHERGLRDFTQLVTAAVEIVEKHEPIRRVLTAQYPHIYVDEYQDLAPGLDRLVKALCFDQVVNAELFAVGDPDQALYEWMGARPDLLHKLAQYPGVTRVELEHNYRCGEAIIQAGNLMRTSRRPIVGSRAGGQVSAVHCPGSSKEQYRHLVAYVRETIGRGVPLHEIAVLATIRDQCEAVTALLRDSGIPVFFRSPEYRLTVVTGFIEAAAAWATLGRETSNYRLVDLLQRWRTIFGRSWSRRDNVALTELLMNLRDHSAQPAASFVESLMERGLKRALAQMEMADDAVEVERMRVALATGGLRGVSIVELAERARKVDRVEVTTMTSSKGLEFDVVLLVGANEGNIPSYHSGSDSAKIAEDGRKFYVSITRAREEVRIFYYDFVVTQYDTIKPAAPSRFLREIGLI